MAIKFFSAFILSIAVLFAVQSGYSQTSPSKEFPNIKIKNFGQMDERFYRGARPKEADFAALKSLGVNTVIDLTDNSDGEQAAVEAAGMRYVNVAIRDKGYPTEDNIAAFL